MKSFATLIFHPQIHTHTHQYTWSTDNDNWGCRHHQYVCNAYISCIYGRAYGRDCMTFVQRFVGVENCLWRAYNKIFSHQCKMLSNVHVHARTRRTQININSLVSRVRCPFSSSDVLHFIHIFADAHSHITHTVLPFAISFQRNDDIRWDEMRKVPLYKGTHRHAHKHKSIEFRALILKNHSDARLFPFDNFAVCSIEFYFCWPNLNFKFIGLLYGIDEFFSDP